METAVQIDAIVLIDYTDWERQKWLEWLGQNAEALKMSVGPHGDNRFRIVGDVVKHIFSAELRYVERLSEKPLTDTASFPNDNVEGLFTFGQQSRKALAEFIESFPAEKWDVLRDFDFFGNLLRATPKKIIIHVLLHEIRHWAQIATLFRLNGFKVEFHDFLFSPVLGGEFRHGHAKA
jgi:uncharacterized damage-inducible protein DinB